jgi:hypothetical protein
LVAQPDAQADRALPEHPADLVAAGRRLGTHGSTLLPYATDIVAIGRFKRIEGSKHTGKRELRLVSILSRCGRTDLSPEGATPELRFRLCEHCRKAYQPQRSSSRFCSERCRQRAIVTGLA